MKLNSKFITGAEYLLNNASNTFEFQYTKKEVEYLSAYLFLNRIEYIPLKVTNSKLVLEIIDQISSSLKVNFNKNMSLKSELEQHIISMLYRLKYGIKVENSLVNYIKNEYGDTFYIIKLTLDDFESRFGIDFNDEELALLTIYFQSAIEQQRQKKKVLVVCQYGLAMSNLLITRLENILNSKYNIESSSLVDLKLEEISKYDLVISTIESLHGDNVLRISSFPTEGDIFKIQKKLTDSVNLINKNCLTQNFLNSKYIFLESKFKDKGSLLQYITEKLLKDNIIQEEYINSLYRREKVGNTDLPNGVAIPHGSSKYGNQTLIVIINNKNKIYWNKYFINNIFIPVISPKDTKFVKSIIKEIYNVINDEQSIYNFPEYLSSIKRRLKKWIMKLLINIWYF